MKVFNGNFDGVGLKVAIVASRFNEFITKELIGGAEDILLRHNVNSDDIHLFRVPGAFEIPATCDKIVKSGKYDGIITLGAVIRGATPHFDCVVSEVSKGVASVGMNANIPVIFGVLTTDTIEQAIERAGTKSGNKGSDCALSLLEMINLYKGTKL